MRCVIKGHYPLCAGSGFAIQSFESCRSFRMLIQRCGSSRCHSPMYGTRSRSPPPLHERPQTHPDIDSELELLLYPGCTSAIDWNRREWRRRRSQATSIQTAPKRTLKACPAERRKCKQMSRIVRPFRSRSAHSNTARTAVRAN